MSLKKEIKKVDYTQRETIRDPTLQPNTSFFFNEFTAKNVVTKVP